ncbi:MAG: tRNA lysidine(34) synthetase TilS [Solirubrobacteraceae bacterium]
MTVPTSAEIEQRVRASGLLAEGRPVVVLLSGGRDSTCLLDLAATIAGCESVTALHLNYGLRDEADADERHCEELCSRLGVSLEVRRPRRPERGNVQAWARDERYGTAAQMALARGGEVAAGHTATDQVETILYRLASSPSRRALLGMRPREGLLVRPLLEFTREQTADYCTARGLTWREDSTNESDEYARNRIRAQLVPALHAVHPGASENVLALAEILRGEAAVLDALVDQVLEGGDRVALSRLRELEPALARLVCQRLADDAAGGSAPGVARRAGEIVALDDHGTVQLDTGGGVVAIAEYGVLRFESRGTRRVGAPEPVVLRIPGSAVFGDQEVRCELGAPARESGVVDRAALGDDLLVRSWRPGDRMAPLGLHGSKSLQDLFTARRVPRRERAGVPVVESGGEIVWVAGVATSERFKVTDATAEAVHLSASRRD